MLSISSYLVIETTCCVKTGQDDNNRKYLRNKSKTGRRGGSWATPHHGPRASCMISAGQSTRRDGSPNRGQIRPNNAMSGPVSERTGQYVCMGCGGRRAQCAMDASAVRMRRRSLLLSACHRCPTRTARRRLLELGEG